MAVQLDPGTNVVGRAIADVPAEPRPLYVFSTHQAGLPWRMSGHLTCVVGDDVSKQQFTSVVLMTAMTGQSHGQWYAQLIGRASLLETEQAVAVHRLRILEASRVRDVEDADRLNGVWSFGEEQQATS